MADITCIGVVRAAWRAAATDEFLSDWIGNHDIRLLSFADLGLPLNADDRAFRVACREAEVVLVTDDRNADTPDSLRAVLDEEAGRADSVEWLPVVTVNVDLVRPHPLRFAYALTEFLEGVDSLRGTGRQFLPPIQTR